MSERLLISAAAAVLMAACVPAAASAAVFGSNLIVNGDAEAGPGSPTGGHVPAPGFDTTAAFTVVAYGAPEFPAAGSPGGSVGGHNFFAGGSGVELSIGSQLIDLTAGAGLIDLGTTSFDLSGYFGGFQYQPDNATLTVAFEDAAGSGLGAPVVIGGVTNADRGNLTGLLFRSATGLVPQGARAALVSLRMNRTAGVYNDGYADNLSLVLTPGPDVATVPEPATWALLLAGFAVVGAGMRRRPILRAGA